MEKKCQRLRELNAICYAGAPTDSGEGKGSVSFARLAGTERPQLCELVSGQSSRPRGGWWRTQVRGIQKIAAFP